MAFRRFCVTLPENDLTPRRAGRPALAGPGADERFPGTIAPYAQRRGGGPFWLLKGVTLNSPKPRPRLRLRRGVLGLLGALLAACLLLAAAGWLLPDVLGLRAPRHYLVLAQNQDELRPTGGFITGVAVVTVAGGRPTGLTLTDANLVDDFTRGPYPAPPEPLQRYMLSELWVLRDANWSPDFPTSAQAIRDLYALGQGQTVDGVVAFDQTALQRFLAVLGPVQVAELSEPVTADNFLALMRQAWSDTPPAEWGTERKEFMGPLARALFDRLKATRDPALLLALGRAAVELLDERHVLLALPEPPLAGWLAARGWDGAVQPGPQDFLMVVDANLGFNKANAGVTQALAYAVDLTDPAAPAAALTITYTNTVKTPKTCVHFGVANASTQYSDYLNDCYWDYWRVLLPAGAEVLRAPDNAVPQAELLSGVDDFSPAAVGLAEAGTVQVAGLFVLAPQAVHTTTVSYRLLPTVVDRTRRGQAVYRLHVQKQPGTGALPFDLSLVYPAGWGLERASALFENAAGRVEFALDLRTDLDMEIVFHVP